MTPAAVERIAKLMLIDILVSAHESYWLKAADRHAASGAHEVARACRAKASLVRDEHLDEWHALMDIELGDVA